MRQSSGSGAAGDLAALQGMAPDGSVISALRHAVERPHASFAAPDALWRRWVRGLAECVSGHRVATANLAVVVIGFQAQSGLQAAVQSVLDQDEAAEIVVVNTGEAPERVRLISVKVPMTSGRPATSGWMRRARLVLPGLAGFRAGCGGTLRGAIGCHGSDRGGRLQPRRSFGEPAALFYEAPLDASSGRVVLWAILRAVSVGAGWRVQYWRQSRRRYGAEPCCRAVCGPCLGARRADLSSGPCHACRSGTGRTDAGRAQRRSSAFSQNGVSG